MQNSKNSKSKNTRQRQNRRVRGGVQSSGRNITQIPRAMSQFPPIPSQMQVSLNHMFIDNRTASITPSVITIGLFEFLNKTPAFLVELFSIYEYARISRVDVHVDVINTGTVPVIAAMGPMPYLDISASTSPFEVAERARSVFKTASGSTGMNRVIITKSWSSFDELGQPVFDKDHWVTAATSTSTVPLDQNAPCIALSIGAADAYSSTTSWSALVNIKVKYHVQMFELNEAIPPASRVDKFHKMDDCPSDNRSQKCCGKNCF